MLIDDDNFPPEGCHFMECTEPFNNDKFNENTVYTKMDECKFLYWSGDLLESNPPIVVIRFLPQDELNVVNFMRSLLFTCTHSYTIKDNKVVFRKLVDLKKQKEITSMSLAECCDIVWGFKRDHL